MSEHHKNTNTDEIDLGQLFQLIGRAFQKLYDFIGSIFKGIFNLIIILLLFIQKNFVVLIASLVIGAVLGYFLDKNKTEKFISKMVVEPNFNSVQQLYNNIEFYNDLAKAEDSIALAEALKITIPEAASIQEIFVDSYSDENQKIKLFDEFVKELDTSTIKAIEFESYLQNFNSLDARFHQISLISTDNSVAKKAQPAIIQSISNNEYFRLQKQINEYNIELQDSIINKQLDEIDSLQKLYKFLSIKELDMPISGTNISLGEQGNSTNKEIALLKEMELLKKNLVILNQDKANKSSILNVISDFPNRGVKVRGVLKSFKFLAPLSLLIVSLSILLLIELKKFLAKKQAS